MLSSASVAGCNSISHVELTTNSHTSFMQCTMGKEQVFTTQVKCHLTSEYDPDEIALHFKTDACHVKLTHGHILMETFSVMHL